MIRKIIYKMIPLIAVMLMAVMLISPVFAQDQAAGKLWFYSKEPPTPLPNPKDWDPNYVGSNPDPWLSESIVIPPSEWKDPFNIWLGAHQSNSTNTKLVVSINKAANASISQISINGTVLTGWSDSKPGELRPHGVFNSPEFDGCALADIGTINNGTAVLIQVNIDLKVGADVSAAKIHFDAFGYSNDEKLVFSPYSHDLTFVIPEAATLILAMAPIAALGIYAYRRKR